ncbi:MAG: ABC transporter permease [Ardenticatenaceae bacterium]|nr:ABC transporter permease [Ardenticatenaceae bacterium]
MTIRIDRQVANARNGAVPVRFQTARRLGKILAANPPAMFGLILAVCYLLIAIGAPQLAPYPYDKMGAGPVLEPPSRHFPFGTDEFGRDVFSRVLLGSRISLRVGVLVVAIAGTVGSVVGLISGFWGGWVDEGMMRITDIFLAVPGLVLALTVATALGPALENAIIGVAAVQWTHYARLMRSGVLAERTKEYVVAAEATGVPSLRMLWRHILPNSYSAVMVQATFDFGLSILLAAGLSFIGAGAQPPLPEWGAMIAAGRQYVQVAWWIATFPGLAIFGAVLAFNLLGDTLRDTLDPRLRKG